MDGAHPQLLVRPTATPSRPAQILPRPSRSGRRASTRHRCRWRGRSGLQAYVRTGLGMPRPIRGNVRSLREVFFTCEVENPVHVVPSLGGPGAVGCVPIWDVVRIMCMPPRWGPRGLRTGVFRSQSICAQWTDRGLAPQLRRRVQRRSPGSIGLVELERLLPAQHSCAYENRMEVHTFQLEGASRTERDRQASMTSSTKTGALARTEALAAAHLHPWAAAAVLELGPHACR